jgi:hypothetical protein
MQRHLRLQSSLKMGIDDMAGIIAHFPVQQTLSERRPKYSPLAGFVNINAGGQQHRGDAGSLSAVGA